MRKRSKLIHKSTKVIIKSKKVRLIVPRGVRNNPRQLDNPAAKKRWAREATTKIDWEKVDEYLQMGCSGVQVAATIGINETTLRKRCEKEKGICFSEYRQQKLAKGESELLKTQLEVAIKNKNPTLLVWMGKQILGQRETPKDEDGLTLERKKEIDTLMNFFKNLQSSKDKDEQ